MDDGYAFTDSNHADARQRYGGHTCRHTSAGRLQLLQGGREISLFAFPIPLLDNAVGLSLGALFVSRADSAKARGVLCLEGGARRVVLVCYGGF